MARPIEYSEDYIKKVDEYLEVCRDEYAEFHKLRAPKTNGYDRLVKVKLPTIEGFALYIDVSVKSLYNWGDAHPEFLQALERIKTVQKERLLSGGLSGDYNPMIAKLVLSANHGMKEKTDITTNDKDLPVPILNVLPNVSDKQDSGDEGENPSGAGGDLSE